MAGRLAGWLALTFPSVCASRYLPKEIEQEINKKFFETLQKTRAAGGGGGDGGDGGAGGVGGAPAATTVVGNGLGAATDPAAAAEGDDIYAQCVPSMCWRLHGCPVQCVLGWVVM